jgi:hypothetical protein
VAEYRAPVHGRSELLIDLATGDTKLTEFAPPFLAQRFTRGSALEEVPLHMAGRSRGQAVISGEDRDAASDFAHAPFLAQAARTADTNEDEYRTYDDFDHEDTDHDSKEGLPKRDPEGRGRVSLLLKGDRALERMKHRYEQIQRKVTVE